MDAYLTLLEILILLGHMSTTKIKLMLC